MLVFVTLPLVVRNDTSALKNQRLWDLVWKYINNISLN